MIKKRTRFESLLFIHISNLCFATTAILISMLSSQFDGWFTALARFAIGGMLGFSQLAITKKPFHIVRIRPWLGRGLFGALAMILYYLSISLGSPGRASLFNNSFPIFVAIISIFALREKIRWATLAGIVFAFAGVALVLWDGTGMSFAADAAGIASGFLAGISYHFNKRASQTEHPVVIYLGVCLVGIIATAFSWPQLLSITPTAAILLVLAGIGAYAAQITITMGLRDIPTTEGSVHTFAKIPLTVLAGWLILGDAITVRFILGTVLLLTGLFLNDRRTANKKI
ncbi:MAG TPA: DMT family transporter [Treponema sp.]|nr:DMT family transporter [Treponema sp.]